MRTSINVLQLLRRIVTAGALALGSSGTLHALVYDFDNIVTGGGPRANAAERVFLQRAGQYMCVDIRESRVQPTNRVFFTFWSLVPHPNSRIRIIAFDTGRHKDLFSSVSVLTQSPGVDAKPLPASPHPFLQHFTPDYMFGAQAPGGVKPGNSIVVAATLASGKAFANVVSAINEGFNPATAATGLRIGVIALYVLGGPPPGVATIYDDGGWAMNATSPRCQRR